MVCLSACLCLSRPGITGHSATLGFYYYDFLCSSVLCAGVYVYPVHAMEAHACIRPSVAEVIDAYELSCECLVGNPSPQQEQLVLLATEPFL